MYLLLLLPAWFALPSHADGYWLLHVDIVGTPTRVQTPPNNAKWIAPVDNKNSITLPSWGASMTAGMGPGKTASISSSCSLSVEIKGTWMGTDPPPASIDLIQSGNASFSATGGVATSVSGMASDGLDPDVTTSYPSGETGISQTPTTNAAGQTLVPPAHLLQETTTSWTIPLTFSASCNLSAMNPSTSPHSEVLCRATSTFTSYTVTVHAQPYNMILSSYVDPQGVTHPGVDVDNVNGILTFHYSVSSTDGVLGDLAPISAYETLDWSGNPAPPGVYTTGLYEPPSPPVQLSTNPTPARYAYKNPDKEVSPALLSGYVMDRFSPPSTGFVAPLPVPFTTWSATQNYLFDDSVTGETKVKIPGPDNNSPFTITRTVTATNLAGTTGTYKITTHGATASEAL